MRAWSRAERARGRRIGYVPTMGFLHEGHLRLVDRARERTDRVVMSIFVNPLQFGAGEDFTTYPRDVERDKQLASERGVECLFLPEAPAMYPADPLVRLHPGPMADGLEGAARPGHFAGVLTVVAKLFHLVEPDIAVFGRKDFQQAMLVRRMADDLNFGLEVDVAPTVRELDGLALSSRNAYLQGDERRAALALSRALRAVEQAWRGGEADPGPLAPRGPSAGAPPRQSGPAGSGRGGCTTRCATRPRPTSSRTDPWRPSGRRAKGRPIAACSTRCATTPSATPAGTTSARCSTWRITWNRAARSNGSCGRRSRPRSRKIGTACCNRSPRIASRA